MKRLAMMLFLLVIASSGVLGQTKSGTSQRIVGHAPTVCGNTPVLSSDGSTAESDFIDIGSTVYYTLNAKAGHSYAIEVWDPFDATVPGVSPGIQVTASDCSTQVTVTDVTAIDPDQSNGFSRRVSWIQSGDGPKQQIAISNPDQTSGYYYYIRVADTTLINPRWSTFSNFVTQYALVNNTSVSLSGTLTFYDNTGALIASRQITVPAAAESFQQIGTPTNKFGFATFAFVGPAGSITGDAYFINSNATVIVPSSLAPRNYQR